MKLTKKIFNFKSHDHGQAQIHLSKTLDALPTGSSAQIINHTGGRHISARLASIGLTIGSEVQIIQNYRHGPIIISVRGVRLALGRGEANKIGVKAK
jgi:ferrous iron transport protein A